MKKKMKSDKIRVACVGDSITYGFNLINREKESYPSVLNELLGKEYEVGNFGFSGRTLLKNGDYPYVSEKLYQDSLNFNAKIVIIKLGTNDTKVNGKKKKSF